MHKICCHKWSQTKRHRLWKLHIYERLKMLYICTMPSYLMNNLRTKMWSSAVSLHFSFRERRSENNYSTRNACYRGRNRAQWSNTGFDVRQSHARHGKKEWPRDTTNQGEARTGIGGIYPRQRLPHDLHWICEGVGARLLVDREAVARKCRPIVAGLIFSGRYYLHL